MYDRFTKVTWSRIIHTWSAGFHSFEIQHLALLVISDSSSSLFPAIMQLLCCCALFLCAAHKTQTQLAWADTKAGDDTDHAADTDVAHEWHVNLQGEREGAQHEHVSLDTAVIFLSWGSRVWNTASAGQSKHEADVCNKRWNMQLLMALLRGFNVSLTAAHLLPRCLIKNRVSGRVSVPSSLNWRQFGETEE